MDEVIIDSNVFLRYFIQDIAEQFTVAKELFEHVEGGQKTGYISILVINEVSWILRKYYGVERKVYLPQLIKILHLDHIKILEAKKEAVINILEKMKKKQMDFTDLYLIEIAGSKDIVSFDRDLKKTLVI